MSNNSLLQVKAAFAAGQISKASFIDEMYAQHQALFNYPALLTDTDIACIQITKDGVIFTSASEDIKLFCEKADKRTAPFEIMNFNEYEPADANLLYSIINNGDTIFDIGANIGWYSIVLANRFPASVIHSFEPLPLTFKSLAKNIAINHKQNIIANNFGLSNEPATLRFFTSAHTSVSNSSQNIAGDADVIETSCEVIKLDQYVADKQVKIDVIKCDVEGAELLVYQGGLSAIAAHQPIIFTEMLRKWAAKFNYHPNDIISLLQPLGYHCFVNNGLQKLEKLNLVTDSTLQTNFFFLHEIAHAAIIKQYGN